ncbi:MAG: hypothetical protein P8M77_08835 [Porticoccaceae bacterium]|nr:hypothetical protein [Porticoccaceae bacterium]
MSIEKKINQVKDNAELIAQLVKGGQIPLKIVSGTQSTDSERLSPGALVAHEGSTVIFVCG